MKQTLYILGITLLFAGVYSLYKTTPTEMDKVFNENTNNTTMNVMWQNVSSWGDSTIELISKVNPRT